MIFKKVKIKYIIILDDPEYNSKNNIIKEKTLDLSNNPISDASCRRIKAGLKQASNYNHSHGFFDKDNNYRCQQL